MPSTMIRAQLCNIHRRKSHDVFVHISVSTGVNDELKSLFDARKEVEESRFQEPYSGCTTTGLIIKLLPSVNFSQALCMAADTVRQWHEIEAEKRGDQSVIEIAEVYEKGMVKRVYAT